MLVGVVAPQPSVAQAPAPPAEEVPGRARQIQLPPNTFNIALLGVDTRPTRDFSNTDVIIIASINPDVPAVTLLSIPRDTRVYVPGVGMYKVNTAFASGGPDLFKETIRYNFGLDIANYAMVNFTGVVHAVDALGGVDVIATCPLQHAFPKDPYYMGGNVLARDYVDTFSGEVWQAGTIVPKLVIDIPKPGVYSLNGLQALAYVRARKGVPGGDVDRGRREQRVVRALLAKARQVGSLSKLTELYSNLRNDVETDLTLESILRYTLMADKIGDAVIRSRYLSGADANGAALQGASVRSANRLDYIEQALNVALNQRINEGIPVEVLNGTSDAGFAIAAADRLKELGFVVTSIKPADQPYDRSLILDHTTTKKGSANSLLLRAFNLNKKAIVAQPNPDGPRYTIIIGPDFNTCYYSNSLRASGSEAIDTQEGPQDVQQPIVASVVVTNTAEIEQAVASATSTPASDANIVLAATALLTPTVADQIAQAPVPPVLAVAPKFMVRPGDAVNVRSAPTTRARTIGRLVGNQSADILGRSLDGNWLQFLLPRSKRLAWVRSDVVHVTGYEIQPPTPPVAESAPPAAAAPALVAQVLIPRGDIVNVRSGPGTQFDILGRLRSRQAAPIVGKNSAGSWWQINYSGQPAWVAARVVRATGNLGGIPVTQQ
jgi:anionic cell wall polymer biosynthesis LytR-Cps2A-Psr (LCP) family protein/uncharacterized protein YgiM (DUF1202 family)